MTGGGGARVASGTSGTPERGKLVLVVDDEAGIREAVALALRDEGYEVATARDGEEALRHMRAHRPAVVLLDLVMPRMNAWQLGEACRQLAEPPPIIAFSAVGPALADAAREIGAVDWLAKPFDVQQLLDLVALHSRSA